jgi:S-DNA-T family DNA segregation ATPase FtsK/SpoIIIE
LIGMSLAEWRGFGRGLSRLTALPFRLLGRVRGWRGAAKIERESSGQESYGRIEPSLHGRNRLGDPAAGKRRKPATAALVTKRDATRAAARQETLDLLTPGECQLPPLAMLTPAPDRDGQKAGNDDALAQNARLLEAVLEDFGVRGEIVKVRPGPVVTLYELEPAPGTKSSRVISLADDIARSMSAISVRVAVIPGRTVIGIELPNAKREMVYLRELLSSPAYESTVADLTLALGKNIGGDAVITDLARMPHLLVAGTTGSGKSVAINTMILSLLYRLPPERCKFIMIDPKMLELSVYDGIPHLLTPVVTDPSKAVVALKWTVREMENRYRAMSQLGVRNLAGYNKRLKEAAAKGETLSRQVQTGFDAETGKPIYEEQALPTEPLPYIVVVIDEMADLMLVAGKEVEGALQRLAQMARAAGIHLIIATQRPSVDVITGTIKANFPTRISFQVTSKIDSRTILGEQGAEQLLGQGDMLLMSAAGRIERIHGPFVSDAEVERVAMFLKEQAAPEYIEQITEDDDPTPILGVTSPTGGGSDEDVLYDQAVALICRERRASTSFVQRHLQIGYNRAARIIERMETEGVISRANHVGKREVLARDIDGEAGG